jgi:hypothetical protein
MPLGWLAVSSSHPKPNSQRSERNVEAMCDRPPGLSLARRARGQGWRSFPFYERGRRSARVLARNCLPLAFIPKPKTSRGRADPLVRGWPPGQPFRVRVFIAYGGPQGHADRLTNLRQISGAPQGPGLSRSAPPPWVKQKNRRQDRRRYSERPPQSRISGGSSVSIARPSLARANVCCFGSPEKLRLRLAVFSAPVHPAIENTARPRSKTTND